MLICKSGELVELRLDSKNSADPRAVTVFSGRGVQLGYLHPAASSGQVRGTDYCCKRSLCYGRLPDAKAEAFAPVGLAPICLGTACAYTPMRRPTAAKFIDPGAILGRKTAIHFVAGQMVTVSLTIARSSRT